MGRIRLPNRPDPSRVQQARIAASRVAQASAAQAMAEEIAATADTLSTQITNAEAAIRADYDAALADVEDRLNALEP